MWAQTGGVSGIASERWGAGCIEQGLGSGKERGSRESAVADSTLGFAWEDGKEGSTYEGGEDGTNKRLGVTLCRHSCVCTKPFTRWRRQNLVGMARTELSPCPSQATVPFPWGVVL